MKLQFIHNKKQINRNNYKLAEKIQGIEGILQFFQLTYKINSKIFLLHFPTYLSYHFYHNIWNSKKNTTKIVE